MIHTTVVAKRIHRARSRADGDGCSQYRNERIDLGSNLLLPYLCSLDSFVVNHQYLRNGLPKCKHTGQAAGAGGWIVHQ